MAQHDYIIADQPGLAFRTDLNEALAAIVSNNSGPTEPATTYPLQWWADTTSGILKQRNAGNNAWVEILDLATGQTKNSVPMSSAQGVAILPSGGAGGLPSPLPASGFLVRYDEDAQAPVWYDRESSEWRPLGGSAGRLFELVPHNGPIEGIDEGFIPAFGQTWFADTYPDAAAGLEAGKQFMVSEVLWQSGVTGNPDAYKGCWSSGGTDGSGRRWYRAPKLNADADYRAPFLRGSKIGDDAGKITDDRIRNIEATFASAYQFVPTGAVVATGPSSSKTSGAQTGENQNRAVRFDASLVVPTGPENSPRYHGVILCIRMFGTVSNPGSVDAAQLATDLGVANAKIQQLESEPKITGTGIAPYYGCRAWVNFNGTGTTTIQASGNVSSVTDNGTGDWTVNLTTGMPNGRYCISLGGGANALASGSGYTINAGDVTTTSFKVYGRTFTGAAIDIPIVSAAVFA